jgi:hypothetical protein
MIDGQKFQVGPSYVCKNAEVIEEACTRALWHFQPRRAFELVSA